MDGDRAPQISHPASGIMSDVELVQIIVPESPSSVKRQYIVCIRTLQNTEQGNELFVYNVSSKQFVLQIQLE